MVKLKQHSYYGSRHATNCVIPRSCIPTTMLPTLSFLMLRFESPSVGEMLSMLQGDCQMVVHSHLTGDGANNLPLLRHLDTDKQSFIEIHTLTDHSI